MIKSLARITVAIAFFGFEVAHAQPSLPQVQAELIGSWLATVEGDTRPRTLSIESVQQKSENVFSLEAEFGYSDIRRAKADAEISQTATERKLALTAKSGAKITATQTLNGVLTGTFFFTDGTTRPITLTKLSADELRTKVEAALKGPEIIKPTAEVPSSCAAFSGKWTGTWGYGVGQQWLWIPSIDSKCVAKVIYSSSKWAHGKVEMVEIKDGTLSIVCGGVDTCRFNVKGDELWAAAYGSAGANNNAVFKRTE